MLRDNVVNGELVVPQGSYFAMGDNRDDSLDSRYFGLVPRDNIFGKPLIVFWSYDAPTEDLTDYNLHHAFDLATHFFTKTRWSRTLKLIHSYHAFVPLAHARGSETPILNRDRQGAADTRRIDGETN
jgi:signal peptidase I